MKLYLVFILSLVLVFNGCKQTASSKSDKIDAFVKECHNMGLFSGAVLVASGGTVIYKSAYGYADLKLKRRLKIQTAFYLASVSKQFMTVLARPMRPMINLNKQFKIIQRRLNLNKVLEEKMFQFTNPILIG